ncbi:MAG TPA: UbiX family flavin prenyltransferase [Bryobacterales bacterium]|nr:UbiX family flavin prenyltransferase [Bryobacterales bacterium]
MTRVVVGISGASGSAYGLRLIERLRARPDVETHLVLSRPGEKTMFHETGRTAADLKRLVSHWHPIDAIGAPIASGSYPIDAMVIAPCSVHTMSAIATGIASNLLVRAADVTLKERRPLILLVRETPLHLGHLRTMVSLAEMGAIIAPPLPAFYTKPETVEDIVDQSVNRVLDLLRLPAEDTKRWQGL